MVEFLFPEQTAPYRRLWMLVERGDAELCYTPPGFEPDLRVTAQSDAFTRWHVGERSWADAVRAGDIRVVGPAGLARALPSWNDRAARA